MSIRTFSRGAYYAPPHFRDNDTYEPVVGCGRFSIIAGIEHSADDDRWRRDRCTFRVRVWPSGASEESVGDTSILVAMPPQDYHWRLSKQPTTRPACYEDDPMQAGVSSGPPGSGCWMVDQVSRSWNGGGGGGGSPHGGTPDCGRARELERTPHPHAPRRELAVAPSGRRESM